LRSLSDEGEWSSILKVPTELVLEPEISRRIISARIEVATPLFEQAVKLIIEIKITKRDSRVFTLLPHSLLLLAYYAKLQQMTILDS